MLYINSLLGVSSLETVCSSSTALCVSVHWVVVPVHCTTLVSCVRIYNCHITEYTIVTEITCQGGAVLWHTRGTTLALPGSRY